MSSGPSFDEINKKLVDKLDPSVYEQKKKLECIQIIAKRFLTEHKIQLLDHVKWITKVGYKYENGFNYIPTDTNKWIETLKETKKFVPDSKKNAVGCIASAVTKGLGIRELGTGKSLHCAVDERECSVHLDNTGFRLKIPYFGYVYTLDGIQHVLYDLAWDDKVVRNAYNASYKFGAFLDRFQPYVMNSKNKFSEYGAEFMVLDRENLKLRLDYSRHFDMGKSIGRGRNFYKEFTSPKEQKVMLTMEGTFEILNWIGK